MKKFIILFFTLFSIFIAGWVFNIFLVSVERSDARDVRISVEVVGRCGNGTKDSGEQCDGNDLGGESCVSLGYGGGALGCKSDCTFDTSACTAGGRGGGDILPSGTKVVFSGIAYPGSKVILLKDAQIVASVLADPSAAFNISLSGLSAGSYIFTIYSEDDAGRRSLLKVYPMTLTFGASVTVNNIFIAPTIEVDKSEVKRGDSVAIFGQSAPSAEITVVVNSEEEFLGKTTADENGAYLYNFDTSQLDMGEHLTKSKAAKDGTISSFSRAISFLVGTKNIMAGLGKKALKGDLNNDGRVNLVDFSIAAYWYKRPISAAFAPKEAERLNGDGRVDLADFSIMAFYWTG